MLTTYHPSQAAIEPCPENSIRPDTIWIDLLEPTPEEDSAVEKALGVSIPTRAEAREIEDSSRLYRDNGALYMTVFILFNADQEIPGGATLTFVLAGDRLVTIRYHQPRAFPLFTARARKGEVACDSAASVLVGLVETIVDRAADVVERTQDEVERIAAGVLGTRKQGRDYTRHLDDVLRGVGRQGDVIARLEESTFSQERLLAFLATALRERATDAKLLERIEIVRRDLRSLSEQMRFLGDRITFLLDATIGAISIAQNQTMKIFSMLAVTLMPPTLVAGLYGMNFKHMPELEWAWGYPLALGVMVLAGLLPYLYFRHRGLL